MIPANGAPHDLEARDVLRSLPFALSRARPFPFVVATLRLIELFEANAKPWQI